MTEQPQQETPNPATDPGDYLAWAAGNARRIGTEGGVGYLALPADDVNGLRVAVDNLVMRPGEPEPERVSITVWPDQPGVFVSTGDGTVLVFARPGPPARFDGLTPWQARVVEALFDVAHDELAEAVKALNLPPRP